MSLRLLIILFVFLFAGNSAALAAGCKPLPPYDNPNLTNNQRIVIPNDECGGEVLIQVQFSGRSQFFNPRGSQDPDVWVSVKRHYPGGPTTNLCSQNPKNNWRDRNFNTFNVGCVIRERIAPYVGAEYEVEYYTNNVCGDPLPSLRVVHQYGVLKKKLVRIVPARRPGNPIKGWCGT